MTVEALEAGIAQQLMPQQQDDMQIVIMLT